MPNNRETVTIVHEAMQAAICIVTHLSAAGCLVGAGRSPRGPAKAPKVEYRFARIALWMRCFADEAHKLDRAIELPEGSIEAVTEAVVVGQFYADPLRFKTSLSATAEAIPLIMAARMAGGSLLRTVAKIVESDARDIYHPDTLRDHAAKLEALELGEKRLAYDDVCFQMELQEQDAKSFSAKWHELHLPLEVERLMIGREENRRPDDPWIRIDAVSDLAMKGKPLGEHCKGANSDLIKREDISEPGALRPTYRYYVRRSAIATYVKQGKALAYRSRSE